MPGPRNAVEKLAKVVVRIPGLRPPPRDTAIVTGMKRRLGKLAANPITNALGRTTLTVTTLSAGVGDPPKVNVIPGTAEATVDCRLLPEDSAEAMIERIRALCDDPDVTLEVLHLPDDVEPMAYDSPLFDAMTASVSKFAPEAVTIPVLLAGGTDARFFRARGVKAYGFEPMVRTVEEEELLHSNNERIRLSEFYRGLKIYHHLLRSFLQ
ncbi:MAG: M20/M25/M40 family metallo-hydrolase [SAR324 cluster bacterium]|nr:M20/M25/M40 family metallo-hydrolase [SAR324 cluster bacterium]